jgi:hypothetical protein
LPVFTVETGSKSRTCASHLGDGPMFHATGHDQELAFFEVDVLIPELHPKPFLDDQEEFVPWMPN